MKTRRLAREVLIVAIRGVPLLPSAAEWAGSSAAAEAKNYKAQATRSTPIAITHDDGFVWSVNPDNDSVSVFQVANDENTKVAEIPVGKEPWCVAITPDDSKAYVANMASGTVSVISTVGRNVIKTIRVGTEPFGCALTPDGGKLYVANQSSDTVSVINTTTDRSAGRSQTSASSRTASRSVRTGRACSSRSSSR